MVPPARLGGAAEFRTLVAGPRVVVSSPSGLPRGTSREGDARVVPGTWMGVTSASRAQTQRTLTDVLHHPPGSVRSSLSQSLPNPAPLQTLGSTPLNTPAILRCILIRDPPSQNERLHPDGSRTITHTFTFSNAVAYAFWSHTTPQP